MRPATSSVRSKAPEVRRQRAVATPNKTDLLAMPCVRCSVDLSYRRKDPLPNFAAPTRPGAFQLELAIVCVLGRPAPDRGAPACSLQEERSARRNGAIGEIDVWPTPPRGNTRGRARHSQVTGEGRSPSLPTRAQASSVRAIRPSWISAAPPKIVYARLLQYSGTRVDALLR